MGIEKLLPNHDLTGVDETSPNSLHTIGHPGFEYLMAATFAAGTALGTYIGYLYGDAWKGAMIGGIVSGFVVDGVMEERYRYERDDQPDINSSEIL